MFIDGIRTSTVVMVAAFAIVAAVRRDWRPLAACWVWLWGFEASFDITRWMAGYGHMLIRSSSILLGTVTVVWFAKQGLRPSMPFVYLTATIWLVWIGLGYHVNYHTMIGLDPTAEALNEAAKTLLAVAYLWPFIAGEASRRTEMGVPSSEPA